MLNEKINSLKLSLVAALKTSQQDEPIAIHTQCETHLVHKLQLFSSAGQTIGVDKPTGH